MAKNYLSINAIKFFKSSLKMLGFIINNHGHGKTRKLIKMFFRSLCGLNVHTLSTLLDFLSTLYFIELRKKYKTNFNIIFLNHIAHIQHQFWDSPNKKITKQMRFGLIVCDEIIKMLLDNLDGDEKIMIINGIRQKLVKGKGFFTYRQKDHFFFQIIWHKISHDRTNMTNDGILVFNDEI